MMYTVYNNSGQITKVLNTQDIDLNLSEGESYIEGDYSDLIYYVENNQPVLKPEKPSEFHEFDYSLKEWVDTKPSDYEEKTARDKRNRLLTETDWTQLPDVSDEIRLKYLAYRQALRDLPEQDGFPDITFPTKPE